MVNWTDVLSISIAFLSIAAPVIAVYFAVSANRRSTERLAETFRAEVSASPKEDRSAKRQTLLEIYHTQGLAQSRVSFYFSLILATLGFVVIIWAIYLAMQSQEAFHQQGRAALTLVAGTVVEAVSGLFFTQSNKARSLMMDFFGKLRDDRKLDESLTLAETIQDAHLKARVQAVLAMHFADAKQPPTILPGFSIPTELTSEDGLTRQAGKTVSNEENNLHPESQR